MKKYIRLVICCICICALLIPLTMFRAQAAETVDLGIYVTYGQTEARSMLQYINQFRTSTAGADDAAGAWFWNSDDTTKTVYNVDGGTYLGELVYDYSLEQAAMVRAAEIAVSFSHTRPNGESCSTAFPSGYSSKGENLAAGSGTAQSAFISLREDSYMYDQQGHRRNMLNPSFNCIGIGHVVVDNVHYWVQILGYKDSPNTTATSANNSGGHKNVSVSSASLSYVGAYTSDFTSQLTVGQSVSAPVVVAEYTFPDHWPSSYNIKSFPSVTWTSSDDSVVSVGTLSRSTNASFTGVFLGDATMTAAFTSVGDNAARTATVDVSVVPASIAGAQVTLEYTEKEYTGKYLNPKVTSVVLNGVTLDPTDDYSVSYNNNQKVGTATVTVTGKGNYSDTASASFTIKECSHVYDSGTVATAATCTTDGQMRYECTKCDLYKTETITAPGHTPGAAATCTAPQKCTVCDAEIKPALGHTPGEAATCTAAQKCTVCDTEIKPALGHTPGEAATCTTPQKCTVCDAEVKAALGHTPGAAATCTAAQKCTVCDAEIKAALGHTPGPAATCSAPQKCTVCDAELAATLEHTPGDEATCTAPQKCTVCDAQIAPAKGHDFGENATCTEKNTCTVCGTEVAAGSHNPGAEATCTTPQKCTICDTELAPAKGHTPGDAATCTAAQKCTVCDAEIKAALGHTPGDAATCTKAQKCTVCDAEIKAALGHTPGDAATCGKDQKCTVCKAVIAKATGKHKDANSDKKCDVCGASVSGSSSNKDDNTPTTGEVDKNSETIVILLLNAMLCGAFLIYIVHMRNKRIASSK